MRVKIFIIIVILPFLFSSCAPSRIFLDTKLPFQVQDLNKQMHKKNVEITPMNGDRFTGKNVHLSEDSLFYSTSGNQFSVSISKIKSITTSPKFSLYSIFPLMMIGSGIYLATSWNSAKTWEGLYNRFYGGIALIGFGSLFYVAGNAYVTHIYYFDHEN